MRNNMSMVSQQNNTQRRSEQGVALVTTLLLLTLLSAVTVGMVIAAGSDELISGYNRNMRSSFYAADSGLNVARQVMLNQIVAAVPTTLTNRAAQPISTSTAAAVQSAILSSFGSSDVSINSGQAAGSWPGKYKITAATLGLAPGTTGCSVTGSPVNNCAAPCGVGVTCTATQANAITQYLYTYNYTLRSVGQSHASELTTLTDAGSLIVNVALGLPNPTVTNFAAYGFFVNKYDICDGSYLVPGTVTGPVFSNGSWNFGSSGSYIFTDPVGAVNPKFGYQFSGACNQSATGGSTSGGVTIAPTFQSGYQLGQNAVPLPSNTFSQKKAVLDGKGVCLTDPCTSSDDPTVAQMGAVLKNASGSAYAGSSGVYLPYKTAAADCPGAPPCMVGGGLYVQGDAAVTLTASTSGSPAHNQQVVTVVQGSTTTTVTIDLTGGTTKIQVGAGTPTIINGMPSQYDPVSGNPQREAALVYVDGNISSLKGPGSNAAAIQNGSALTVMANGNLTVTDDLLYNTKPVTTTQNQIPGTPPSTLIPGNDSGQVLGLYTNTGDIQLANCSGCGNLEIDASIATISATGTGGVINIGSQINTLTILGGRIQNNIKNINSITRNVIFDRRFSNNGFAPPWFPSTKITPTGISGTTVTPTIQRVQWLNQTPF
jgi:Tfp pilus assembly protein PilX